MKTPLEYQERLKFLMRVVEKEIFHLNYAVEQVFAQPINYETVQNLDQSPGLALKIEAFTSRFCRLQDTLGDKLLPALLKALGETENALLNNLNKAEKYGWLESSEQWITLRLLRNQMIHEYIEDPLTFLDAITAARNNLDTLKKFANELVRQATVLVV